MGKAKAPPPPDYSGVAAASKESAQYAYQLGQDQLTWAKQQDAMDRAVSDQVVGESLATDKANSNNAAKDRARYESVYQPLEDSAVAEAKSYADGSRKDLEMGRAQAGVGQQFDSARTAAQQQLESFGIDPSSTRYAALDLGSRNQQAAATAAAGNQASENVDATGRALRSDAINVGRGMPGQVAQSYGTALQAGNSAVGAQLGATASAANNQGTAPQWQGLGNQAVGQWGNTLTQGYNAQLGQFKANQDSSSGWGSALGLIGGIAAKALPFSDERVKENIEPVGKTFDGQTVYRYNYKGDPAPQIGLIAQEVEQRHPDAVGEDEHGLKHVNYDRAIKAATGGAVPLEASPSMGQQTDDVNAKLNAGEFVLPKDVVSWLGEEKLQKMIMAARKAQDGAQAKPTMGAVPAGARPSFVSGQQGAVPA